VLLPSGSHDHFENGWLFSANVNVEVLFVAPMPSHPGSSTPSIPCQPCIELCRGHSFTGSTKFPPSQGPREPFFFPRSHCSFSQTHFFCFVLQRLLHPNRICSVGGWLQDVSRNLKTLLISLGNPGSKGVALLLGRGKVGISSFIILRLLY
jgi:hypothetical protein